MKRSMRKMLSLLMVFLMTLTAVVPAYAVDEPAGTVVPANHLVISQVYGGGSGSGATYTHDFVELYNPTATTVSLAGLSLQYGSAGSTKGTAISSQNIFALSGSIEPGKYCLVQLAGPTGTNPLVGKPLPKPDLTGTLALSATAGKIVLASKTTGVTERTDTAVIDFVGYGTTANDYETAAAPAPSSTTSLKRKTVGVDTDNNSTDFVTQTPAPINSSAIDGIMVETKCDKPIVDKTNAVVDPGTIIKFSTTTAGATIEYNTVSATHTAWTAGDTVTVSEAVTYYVRAIKTGLESSDVATFTYGIKDPNQVMNVKEVLAFTGTTENVTVKGTLAYFATSFSNPVIYSEVEGKTYALYIFGSAPKGAKIGDVLQFNGKFEIRYGMPQLSSILSATAVSEPGVSVVPKEMTVGEIITNGSSLLGQIVKIKSAKLGTYNAEGSTPITDATPLKTINIYKATPYPLQVVEGDIVDLYAMITKNNSTIQLSTGLASANGYNIYDVVNDTKAPVVTLNDSYVNAKPGMDYNFTVRVEDNKGVQSVKATYAVDSAATKEVVMTSVAGGTEYGFTIPGSDILMESLQISVAVEATDVTNLKFSASKLIAVDAKPQFAKLSPARGGITGDEKSPKIAVTLANAGSAPEVKLTLKQDKTIIAENQTMTAGTEANTFEYQTTNLADGNYTVSVSVKREDGVTTSAIWNFTVGTPSARAFFGQLHAHTAEYSDGSGKLSNVFDHLSQIPESDKVDFVAVTDHSNYFDTSSAANPPEAMNDKSKMTADSKSKWDAYTSAMRAFNTEKGGSAVALPGYEMTWSGGPGHINTFNSVGLVSRNNSVLNSKTADAGLKAYYDELIKNPDPLANLSQFNHPGKTFGTFADFAYWSPTIDNKMVAVEVGNGEGAIGSGGYFPSYTEYTKALDKGWHVAPTNNQDNHKGNWGNANTSRTVIITNDLSENGLLNGLKNMSTYATEDKNLNIQYTMNNQMLGSIISEVPTTPLQLKIAVDDPDLDDVISKIDIVTNGGRIAASKTFISNVAEWHLELPSVQGYYYVRVTQADKNIAVTAPVWVGQAPRVGINSVEVNTMMPVTGEKLTLTTTLFNNEDKPATIKSVEYKSGETVLKTDVLGLELLKAVPNKQIFEFTPNTPGLMKILISVVMLVDGQEKLFTQEIDLNVRDSSKLVYIGVDASHFNEYVNGNYKNSMTNFANLAVGYDVRVVELKTSEALIEATKNDKFKMMVLTPPTRRNGDFFLLGYTNYSDAEIAAIRAFAELGKTVVIAGWSDNYEKYTAYSDKTPHVLPAASHMSAQQNKLLKALGSSLRIADDELQDPVSFEGSQQRLRLKNYNMENPFLTGVIASEQVYSNYGGSSIYAVGLDELPTTVLPTTVSPIVYGFSTSVSVDKDNDGTTGTTGVTVPKYSDKLMAAASENVAYGNGKSATIIVGGAVFMSNFEIQAVLDSYSTPAYSNFTILENVVKFANPVTITEIAKVHAAQEGETFTVKGIVTSNASGFDKETAFFDTVYIQDGTAGIDLFPVSGNLKAGQTVQVTGITSSYNGERQLNVQKIAIVDPAVKPLPAPIEVTTEQASKAAHLGSLVTVKGTIKELKYANNVIESIYIADSSNVKTRIFIDGYITKDKTIANLVVGAELTAIGLSSIDTEGARIRIRDRSDVTCTPAIKVTTAELKSSLTAPLNVDVPQQLEFTVDVSNALKLNTMTVQFRFDDKQMIFDEAEFLQQGVHVLKTTEVAGGIDLLLGLTQPVQTDDKSALLKLTFDLVPSAAKRGNIALKMNNAVGIISGIYKEMPIVLASDTANVEWYSASKILDVNGDGKVSIVDFSIALDQYKVKKGDATWSTAIESDVNYDGVVDLADYTLILMNMK